MHNFASHVVRIRRNSNDKSFIKTTSNGVNNLRVCLCVVYRMCVVDQSVVYICFTSYELYRHSLLVQDVSTHGVSSHSVVQAIFIEWPLQYIKFGQETCTEVTPSVMKCSEAQGTNHLCNLVTIYCTGKFHIQ